MRLATLYTQISKCLSEPFFKNFVMLVLVFLIISLSGKNVSGECVFKVAQISKNYTFDLSGLESNPHEKVKFSHGGASYIVYVSVCKRLADLPVGYLSAENPPTGTRAVLMRERPKSSPDPVAEFSMSKAHVVNESLTITHSSSVKCNEGSQTYKMLINFKAADLNQKPELVNFNSRDCEISIVWKTVHAAPHNGFQCSFSDNSHNFNLSPLKASQFYNISVKGDQFLINFCRPVVSDVCRTAEDFISLCVVKDNSDRRPMTLNQNSCKYSEKAMTLECNAERSNGFGPISVQIVCDSGAFKPIIKFNSKAKHKVVVTVRSFLTCTNMAFQPHWVFSPRGTQKYNLPECENVKVSHQNATIVVNPCGTLVSDDFWLSGYSAGGAVIDTDVATLKPASRMKIDMRNTSVFVTLFGDSGCPYTGGVVEVTMRVHCSDLKSDPVVESPRQCLYQIDWDDPTVCPVRGTLGQNCVAQDVDFGITYDLSDGVENVLNTEHGDLKFEFNFCGHIKRSCHKTTDVSVCLRLQDREIVIGKRSTQNFMFDNRYLVFEMMGEKCLSGGLYQTVVYPLCDYGAPSNSSPVLSDFNKTKCLFEFTWNTSKACQPARHVDCFVKKSTEVVDLSPLRRLTSNYRISINESAYVLLNVCGPLWRGRGVTASTLQDSAASLIKDGSSAENIGFLREGLHFNSRGEPSIVYKTDVPCRAGSRNVTATRIVFRCHRENLAPEFTHIEDCEYNFLWKTNYSCFKDIQRNVTESIDSNSVVESSSRSSHLSSMLSNTVLSSLRLDRFAASSEQTNATPAIVEKSVHDFSKNVQPEFVPVVSLMPLEPTEIVLNDRERLVLNSIRGVFCGTDSPKSYACLMSDSRNISLGSNFTESVDHNTSNSVTINFYNGADCDAEKGAKYSASLFVICSRNHGRGHPEFTGEIKNCNYKFVWVTSLTCPDDVVRLTKMNCTVLNKSNGRIISLLPVFGNPNEFENGSTAVGTSLCSSSRQCSNDMCVRNGLYALSFGEIDPVGSYNYKSNSTFFSFYGGDYCIKDVPYSFRLQLKCSEMHSKKWAVEINNCRVSVEFESSQLCFTSVKPVRNVPLGISSAARACTYFSGVVMVLIVVYLSVRFRAHLFSKCQDVRTPSPEEVPIAEDYLKIVKMD